MESRPGLGWEDAEIVWNDVLDVFQLVVPHNINDRWLVAFFRAELRGLEEMPGLNGAKGAEVSPHETVDGELREGWLSIPVDIHATAIDVSLAIDTALEKVLTDVREQREWATSLLAGLKRMAQ
jgi:hypothetical protein